MKIKTLLPLALSVAALGGVTTALAGGPDHMPPPPSQHSVYVGAGMTMNMTGNITTSRDVNNGIGTNNYTATGNPRLGWKAFVGYAVNSWFDGELTFTDPGSQHIQSAGVAATPEAITGTLDANSLMLDLDGVAHMHIYSGLSGFVRAGFGLLINRFASASGLNNFPSLPGHRRPGIVQNGGTGDNYLASLNYGVGLSYEFMRQYGVQVSYTNYVVPSEMSDFQTTPNIIAFDLSYRFAL